MRIQESAENYLETILQLSEKSDTVRAIDVVRALGFSKPSVSYAMKQFRENGYILVSDSGAITLTESGRGIAERVLERHTLITDMLVAIGVSEQTAREDACRIEHVISGETFDAIKRHTKR
ncbi:MAG: metal-dependent transcriptional regulator [Clostridiales bacterium]|jgi:Mn-dependent DtxR family transcriptional regulator|nr:metal-dependent transcriptional regulator [Clostridiales bacterium]